MRDASRSGARGSHLGAGPMGSHSRVEPPAQRSTPTRSSSRLGDRDRPQRIPPAPRLNVNVLNSDSAGPLARASHHQLPRSHRIASTAADFFKGSVNRLLTRTALVHSSARQ
jgi:hypothetical protein